MWGMNVAELNGNASTIPADPFDAIVDPQGEAGPAPGTRLASIFHRGFGDTGRKRTKVPVISGRIGLVKDPIFTE